MRQNVFGLDVLTCQLRLIFRPENYNETTERLKNQKIFTRLYSCSYFWSQERWVNSSRRKLNTNQRNLSPLDKWQHDMWEWQNVPKLNEPTSVIQGHFPLSIWPVIGGCFVSVSNQQMRRVEKGTDGEIMSDPCYAKILIFCLPIVVKALALKLSGSGGFHNQGWTIEVNCM